MLGMLHFPADNICAQPPSPTCLSGSKAFSLSQGRLEDIVMAMKASRILLPLTPHPLLFSAHLRGLLSGKDSQLC